MISHLTFLTAALALFVVAGSFAKPAKPGVITATQPDGTELSILLHGDERGHITTTIDGYPLLWDNTLGYVYATVEANGMLTSTVFLVESRTQQGWDK